MQKTNEKRAYTPGEKPDTELGSPAGETWHYRDEGGEKLDPVAYIYTHSDGGFGAEAENFINVRMETRAEAEEWVEAQLKTAGYTVVPATKLEDTAEPAMSPCFPRADICISAPNVEIGVTVPVVDSEDPDDGEHLQLVRPGSVMLVGGGIKFCKSAGYQPTICHLIDHATGDLFSIPPYITDQEVVALLKARRKFVRQNLPQSASPDAAPDNDEMVN